MAAEGSGHEPRISAECPTDIREILTLASRHDVSGLKKLLTVPGRGELSGSGDGETPLHAAIRASGNQEQPREQEVERDISAAKETVHELFLHGAIWNDLDSNNETPGCVAWRLGETELYDLCVQAGVRAELLFSLMDGYEQLSSDAGGEGEEEEVQEGEEAAPELVVVDDQNGHVENGEDGGEDTGGAADDEAEPEAPEKVAEDEAKDEEYLRSRLTYSDGKLVDDSGNAVMMAWETDIMRQSVDALVPGREAGKRILNIGFGMGIIDTIFAETKPRCHHIVEAHPEVLEHLSSTESKFGPSWEAQGPEPGAFKVFAGRWQDVCQKLLKEGQVYDAIYFDTFGEDYAQLRNFFTEYVLGLLDEKGIFGFFNGLGADRRICYDVYTKVVELHLADAGLDVDWKVIDVDLKGLDEAGKGEWAGVKRRYWTLDKYRLPICTFLG